MGRKTRPQKAEEPEFKLIIPPTVWRLIQATSEIMGLGPRIVLKQLLIRLELMVKRGDVAIFGPEFEEGLKQVKVEGQLANEKTALINISELHRDKSKSGFKGVIAYGRGRFAVHVRSPNGEGIVQLGTTYEKALEGAQARLEYYRLHALPYGELENALDEERKAKSDWTDGELVKFLNELRPSQGKKPLNLPPGANPDLRDIVEDPGTPTLFGIDGSLEEINEVD